MEYFYDAHGNLVKDLNKKIGSIQYNSLNLPGSILFEDGNRIDYLYAADGTKLRTVHTVGGKATTTDYCGKVIYEDGTAIRMLTDAGYISLADNRHHYYVADHQGNNRIVVGEDGTAEEVNHYYPFGGTFASSSASVQPYKYNGKELDTRAGLDWYDYGARMYDAAIGRWHAVDPLAEKYVGMNVYGYCAGNPVKFVDPDGNFFTNYQDEYGNLLRQTNDGINRTVTVPKARLSEFKEHLRYTQRGMMDSKGWNDYWADEFKGTEAFQPANASQAAVLSSLHSSWARTNGVEYLKDPNMWNWLKFVASEVLSQYTDPELVAGGLSVGVSGIGHLTINNIISNPRLLRNIDPKGIRDIAIREKGIWSIGTLNKGSHKGLGVIIREQTPDGKLTGRMIQWHPGGGHHGPDPYWKISTPQTGTKRYDIYGRLL